MYQGGGWREPIAGCDSLWYTGSTASPRERGGHSAQLQSIQHNQNFTILTNLMCMSVSVSMCVCALDARDVCVCVCARGAWQHRALGSRMAQTGC